MWILTFAAFVVALVCGRGLASPFARSANWYRQTWTPRVFPLGSLCHDIVEHLEVLPVSPMQSSLASSAPMLVVDLDLSFQIGGDCFRLSPA